MDLKKYSFGIGDRFAHQGKYQLKAIQTANEKGIEIIPVWNKSNREHEIIGSEPANVKEEAQKAVSDLNWANDYHVDADHINLSIVDNYVDSADFFTLDLAETIGKIADESDIASFIEKNKKYTGKLNIPGIAEPLTIDEKQLLSYANTYLFATQQAKKMYDIIEAKKGKGNFITEVSIDEVEVQQTPAELFFILLMLSDQGVPVQTIAPKFTGRFNKGVDYVGDIKQFRKEFEEDILVIQFAIKEFGLPENLKLSVHSGSDKFSIYPIMAELIAKYDTGLHVKTAGTTWLEEVIGLAEAGNEALDFAKLIYEKAFSKKDELCKPYATVIDIKDDELPGIDEVKSWTGEKFANALRHIPGHTDYNPNFRQLIHVSYKIAAQMKDQYFSLLDKYEEIIGKQVYENIYDRHIKRLFHI